VDPSQGVPLLASAVVGGLVVHLDRFWIRDLRSVWGEPLEVRLGRDVTALVGPNRSGKSTVVRGLVAALAPDLEFDPARELPAGRPDAVPEVTLRFIGRYDGHGAVEDRTVTWMSGQRVVQGGGEVDGPVVHAGPEDTPTDVVARLLHLADPGGLVGDLERALATVLPDLGEVRLDGARVVVRDRAGFDVPTASGVRAATAMGLARHLAMRGIEPAATVIEHPEAWLHPAAQEATRDGLEALAVETDAPVVITTESPFLTPRGPRSRVVALAKDPAGRTRFVGAADGDEPQAPLLGGLFRDPGFGAVLDRTSRIPSDVAAVLIVEGGTDEAYLRAAARALGRERLLDDLVIDPAGGAMAAALRAIVLRAESEVPLLVLLDNDDPGRRAKDTLTSRFGFDNRRQVTTYAEVVPDHPVGTEAEDVFAWRFVERFVAEQGDHAIRGKRLLRRDEWHFDLSQSAKSAFVAWVDEHVRPEHLERWATLLDVLAERLGLEG
jgi:5S rRNA maturation endonuclease (ribonuclease M5)